MPVSHSQTNRCVHVQHRTPFFAWHYPIPCAALVSGRALKVTRCIQEVACINLFLLSCLSNANFLSPPQMDADDCAGIACASEGPRPSATSTIMIQGAANNLKNAMPSQYAEMVAKRTETTVVDVALAFEMYGIF